MRKTKTRLALLAALAVVLAMIAATIAFNLFIGWKIESDAVRDIEFALDINSDEAGTGRVPNYISLDSSYGMDPDTRRLSAPEEVELAAWFAQHPTEGVVSRVTLGDWPCYAAMVSDEQFYEFDPYEHVNHRSVADFDYFYEPGYLVAYIDITAEQALTTSVNMAFAIIALFGAAIAAAAGYAAGRRIEQAQDAQKRFYENMSHELKTPLAAIRGYAEGAEAGVVDENDAMRAIERESEKMTSLIDEILGLSRLEAGAVHLNRETINVDDFVQDCLMPFEGAVRAKGLDVQLDLMPVTVEADRDLFDHALSNVFSNAVRHAASEVRVSNDSTSIRVANDGAMPTDDQIAHLFERFYAGDGGSTGIGLSIAHEIATMHGWRISASIQEARLVIAITFSQ